MLDNEDVARRDQEESAVMAGSNVPAGRKYTKDHEWAKYAGKEVTVGITEFAVEQLGDITLVGIDAKPGDTVTEGKAFGTIESVKTLSDLFAPVSGKLVRVNQALEGSPELVNEDCYEKGWMVVIETSDTGDTLLEPAMYTEFLKAAAH
jgi:glycine cleavage system H protein